MTLQYLQLHRYNAQPRIEPKSTGLTFEEAMSHERNIKRMAELAQKENKAAGFTAEQNRRPGKSKAQTLGARIFEAVKENPYIYTHELCTLLRVKNPRQLYNSIQSARRAAAEAGYHWCVEDVKIGSKQKRRYWVEART